MLSTELKRKLATVKSLKADVSSVSASSQRLKLETSAFKLLTVAKFTSLTQLMTLNYHVSYHFVGSQEVWVFKMATE